MVKTQNYNHNMGSLTSFLKIIIFKDSMSMRNYLKYKKAEGHCTIEYTFGTIVACEYVKYGYPEKWLIH